jgi:hypothetical protein
MQLTLSSPKQGRLMSGGWVAGAGCSFAEAPNNGDREVSAT